MLVLTGTCLPGDNPLRLLRILARNADLITYIIPKLSSYWKLLDTCGAELLQYQQSLILFKIRIDKILISFEQK